CHGGTNNLFLQPYASLFTTGNHAPVVVAGDTNSVLIKKIKGTAGFGGRMPDGGGPMDAADLNTLIEWIKNGAIENPSTSVLENTAGVIPTFQLKQNYPNPFNPSTTIEFSVPKTGNVRLALYDELGKESAVLLDQAMESGSYSYRLNASALPSGVYYYRIQSSGSTLSKQLMLLK
ncbi:MAG: T9SS type A sorting domain-containing protein, partial [Bacteroidetes bacterium]|nr:T9SS type A sorting domain-containing protein [Bacteroidota bacterium]